MSKAFFPIKLILILLFFCSCCTDLRLSGPLNSNPSSYPTIEKLTLVLSGTEYKIIFSNKKAEVILPKYVSTPKDSYIKLIEYSKNAKGDIVSGDTKKVESGKLLFIVSSDDKASKYTVYITLRANLNKFSLALREKKRFYGRSLHDVVAFKGKLWVIGGDSTGEVWSSTDGIDWSLETPTAQFGERRGHTITVFKNRLWLIAGQRNLFPNNPESTEADDLSDVWSSEDGVNWIEELNVLKSPFTGRHSQSVVVFKKKLWLIGGGSLLKDDTTVSRNDVWSSIDGRQWKKVVDAPFLGRRVHTTVVFQDKMWVIGGEKSDKTKLNDIWYSSNGINWTKAPNPPFVSRAYHYSLVYDNEIWVIGGVGDDNLLKTNFVWHSSDGVSWAQIENISQDNPFPSRSWASATVYDKKMWIIGGGGSNASWYSTDGQQWKKTEEIFLPRFSHSSIVFNDKLWIIGGRNNFPKKDNNPTRLNDLWSSTDGISWQRNYPSSSIFKKRSSHISITFKNNIWVIGGLSSDGDFLNDVWSSSDGINWVEKTSQAEFSPRIDHAMVEFKDKLWVIGGKINNKYFNDIWSSSNGISWTQITPSSEQFSARTRFKAFVLNNKLWVIGGIDSEKNAKNDVWSSPDGVSWTKEIENTNFSPRSGFELITLGDKLWIIGGINNNIIKSDAWSSKDGINWKEEIKNTGLPKRIRSSISIFKNRVWVIGGTNNGEMSYDIWVSN